MSKQFYNWRGAGRALLAVLVLGLISACATPHATMESSKGFRARANAMAESETSDIATLRMLIHSASLRLITPDPSTAASKAGVITAQAGGYVENTRIDKDQSAQMVLRVPAVKLESVLAQLSRLGKLKSRYVSSTDVTEEYVDLEARLKNAIELRNRLRALLDRATKIKDVLAIETELTRIQSEIDSMEGRLKVLRNQVQLARIDLTLEQKRILGPLGYLGAGLGWTLEKLFIIK